MRRFIRNVLTDEFEELSDNPAAEFEPLNEKARARVAHLVGSGRRTGANPWYKDRSSRPMSIAPEQATRERIERENEEARRHGTGAYYRPDGTCMLPTRGARRREMQRRAMRDNDGGYGDG